VSEQSNERHNDSQINLGQIVGKNHKYELSVSNETPEDASARRMREMADAELKRKMTYSLFCFAIFMVAIVFGSCVYLFMTGGVEDKKWAASIISAITSGLIGFLIGQGKK